MSLRFLSFWLVVLALSASWGQAVAGSEPAPLDMEAAARDETPAATRADASAHADPADPGEVGPPAPWWVDWSHDRNGNRLDDELEAEPWTPASRFDVFVRFSREPHADDVRSVVAIAGTVGRVFPLAEAVYLVAVDPARFDALLALPSVVAIERESRLAPALDVASPTSMVTFSPELGNGARARWKVIGRDVVVAVLDTGIDQEHEAFEAKRFLGGYDASVPTGSLRDHLFTMQPFDLVSALNVTFTTDTPMSEVDPDDRDDHGTPVAGVAFGVDPNGTYHGVASAAKFLDVKVTVGSDDATTRSDLPYGLGSTMVEGLEFVRRYNEGRTYLGDPGNDTVDIVTISLAEEVPDPKGDSTLAHAVNRLVDTGVVVVTAAGNCGPGSHCTSDDGNATIGAPASAKQAITVGAYDDANTTIWTDDVMWTQSSRGPNGGEPKPNVVAPGVNITTPRGEPVEDEAAVAEYEGRTGTSLAAPMVAGIVALLLEADPDLEPVDVKRVLMASARDLGPEGWDETSGAGAVRAYLAVGVTFGFITLEEDEVDEFGREVEERLDDAPPPKNESKPKVPNQPPEVVFKFAPRTVHPGQVVVFVDRSTDPERNALVAYNWDLGDGNLAKGERAAHAYDRPGDYVVRLSVTDVHGMVGHARETVTVLAPAGETKESGAPVLVPLLALGVVLVGLARRRVGGAPRS